jgi:hypothetical protein
VAANVTARRDIGFPRREGSTVEPAPQRRPAGGRKDDARAVSDPGVHSAPLGADA